MAPAGVLDEDHTDSTDTLVYREQNLPTFKALHSLAGYVAVRHQIYKACARHRRTSSAPSSPAVVARSFATRSLQLRPAHRKQDSFFGRLFHAQKRAPRFHSQGVRFRFQPRSAAVTCFTDSAVPEDVFGEVPENVNDICRIAASMDVKKTIWRRTVSSQSADSVFAKKSSKPRIPSLFRKAVALLTCSRLWFNTLQEIEGNYGSAVASFFLFLKWLFLLNVTMSALFIFFVVVPGTVYLNFFDHRALFNETSSVAFPCNGAIAGEYSMWYSPLLDFLQGTGWLSETALFIGSYPGDLSNAGYKVSVAHVFVILLYFFISLVIMVKSAGTGIKYTILTESSETCQKYFMKVFSGWDFCVRSKKLSLLKHKLLCRDFKTELAHDRERRRKTSRTLQEKLRLYAVRTVVNYVNIGLILGSFLLIYVVSFIALQSHPTYADTSDWKTLILQYLPSMAITFINFFVPTFFSLLSRFEDYSPDFEVHLNLLKVVFLRLSSIIVLLIVLYFQIGDCDLAGVGVALQQRYLIGSNGSLLVATPDSVLMATNCSLSIPCICWETYIGQQFYRLVVLDLVVAVLMTFIVDVPRRIIVDRYDNCCTRFFGKRPFDLSSNVLDIVYTQTLCWLGSFCCPFLPFITSLKILVIFYLKKYGLVYNCDFVQKPYRFTRSHAFFMLMLLLAFFVSFFALTYCISGIKPSDSCGPFQGSSTVWTVVMTALESVPFVFKSVVYFTSSPYMTAVLIVCICIAIFYFHTKAEANKHLVEYLKLRLVCVR